MILVYKKKYRYDSKGKKTCKASQAAITYPWQSQNA